MNLTKLLTFSLIFLVSLIIIGCSKNPVTETETQTETNDCSIISPEQDAPLNFLAHVESSEQVELAWNFVRLPSNYKVYRNNTLIGTTINSTYFDNFSLTPEIKYSYYVYSEATAKKSRLITILHYSGYLSEINTQDNYTISFDNDCQLGFGLTKDASLDLSDYSYLEIYNSTGTTKIYSNYMSNGLSIKAGTYIIRVNRTAGKGNFRMVCYMTENIISGDAEPNDTKENSILVQPDAIVQGDLGFNGETQNSTDIVDFYRIDIPTDNAYGFTVEKSREPIYSTLDLGISILRNDGLTPVSEFNTIGANSVTKQLSLTTGTYYIKVIRGFAKGSYQFKMCSGN
jgi:hypothetical protein